MTETGKEKCAHTSLRNEVDQLRLSTNHLKNLVYSMSVVMSERMEHTQEYEALLTLFDAVRNHIEDVQGCSEKISELLEPCALEVSKD
ncbi:hypothetical protein [Pseudovibrio sp. Tun.PSC04-5.I4]|uniref:hypothetical protein n=1 Tax=Pseudovibrio sp. Tun.PSC04-5.I4 TaxID=1798213 RepID=UPI00088DA6D6|nr:hypothetical protein [Pseudovibrio sp. Tun.PSC04-5.I4]SDQ73915.1 hypothetical protein SAMN04515695_1198 [Pseudovibrio sp. Tun.PSC04-5.I4]